MILNKMKLFLLKKKWRMINKHNFTNISSIVPIKKIIVGNYTYGTLNVLMHNDNNKLVIGNYCSIAPNVTFIVSSDHSINHLSSYPFKVKIMGQKYEAISKGDIIIEDDVWIGYGSIILSGINIGQGAVIAAGSVVTKDIPPYAIVGGIPAKVIKYRFNKEICDALINFDWSNINEQDIKDNIDYLYSSINTTSDLRNILYKLKK